MVKHLQSVCCCLSTLIRSTLLTLSFRNRCDGITSFGKICWCNVLAAYLVLVICKFQTLNFVNQVSVEFEGMAGKFVDTSAIRKSNVLLKKRLT